MSILEDISLENEMVDEVKSIPGLIGTDEDGNRFISGKTVMKLYKKLGLSDDIIEVVEALGMVRQEIYNEDEDSGSSSF